MELDDQNWRLCSAALARGVSGELEEEYWRLCSTIVIVVRGVAGELEDENWRLRSKTLDAEDLGSRDPHRQGLTHTHITHRDPRTASTYSDTHTDRDSYTHRHRYTHRDPHTASTHST